MAGLQKVTWRRGTALPTDLHRHALWCHSVLLSNLGCSLKQHTLLHTVPLLHPAGWRQGTPSTALPLPNLGCAGVLLWQLLQPWPLLPNGVQHLLVANHLPEVPLVACIWLRVAGRVFEPEMKGTLPKDQITSTHDPRAPHTVLPLPQGLAVPWTALRPLDPPSPHHSPSNGMYSMKRTSRGRPSVKATKSSSSSSFRPRITTQFTWPRQLGSESCLQRALMRTTFGVWHCSAPACASGHPLFHGWGILWWPLLFSIPNEGGELGPRCDLASSSGRFTSTGQAEDGQGPVSWTHGHPAW